MNTEKKEHVVTEVYYPLGKKIPYLRSTGKPLRINDIEFDTWLTHCTSQQFEDFKNTLLDDLYAGVPLSEIMPKKSEQHAPAFDPKQDNQYVQTPEPVYRTLEPGEEPQKGDHALSECQEWYIIQFPQYLTEAGKKHIRTTRPKPTNPVSNFDPKGEEGKKKPQLALIPPVFNTQLANALAFGAYHRKEPYGPWNWRKTKVEYMTYIHAMKRHIDALLEREDVASDSGVHHLGHIAASCAIVLDAAKHGTLVDDRPPAKLNSFEIVRKGEWEYVKDNSSPGKLNSEPVVDNGAFKGVE